MLTQISEALELLVYVPKTSYKVYTNMRNSFEWLSLLVLFVFYSLSIQPVANIIIATRIHREVCNYECHTFFRVG